MDNSRDPVRIVTAVVSRVTGIPEKDLTPDAHIRYELGIDSLKALELLASIEKEIGAPLNENECVDFEQLGEFFEYVRRKAGE